MQPPSPGNFPGPHGVVAVVPRRGKLLVIERSQLVRAPGMFCFPGGGIESGESEAEAVVRELAEELALPAVAVRRLWTSVTPWNVSLAWWLAQVAVDAVPVPNEAEVASFHWLTVAEICQHCKLLTSNLDFFAALERREFCIEGIDGFEPDDATSCDTFG